MSVATASHDTVVQFTENTLSQVEKLDKEASLMSHGEDPTLYLWKGGLTRREIGFQDAFKLASILVERRRLLGDAGPLLSSSTQLNDYLCSHYWFVIAESIPAITAQAKYRELVDRDPRFLTAETAIGPKNPSMTGILIGFFVSREIAMQLTKQLGQRPSSYNINRAFMTNSYQPNCSVPVS